MSGSYLHANPTLELYRIHKQIQLHPIIQGSHNSWWIKLRSLPGLGWAWHTICCKIMMLHLSSRLSLLINSGFYCIPCMHHWNLPSSGEARKFDFLSKIWPWRSRSIAPKTIGILTNVFCTSGPNLVILARMGDELWCGQAQNGVNFYF